MFVFALTVLYFDTGQALNRCDNLLTHSDLRLAGPVLTQFTTTLCVWKHAERFFTTEECSGRKLFVRMR